MAAPVTETRAATAPPARPRPRASTVAVPFLVAVLLGSWGLTRHGSMWRDESVTYQVAHRSTGQIVALLRHVDAVHGLYYLLVHAVFDIWDGGLVALRLPSVLGYAVAAAFVAASGCRLGGERVGLLSGVAFALLPIAQKYGQEGRSYALVAMCAAAATYLFLRALADGERTWWVGYVVAVLVATYLNEFAVLVLLAHGVTVATEPGLRARRRPWLLCLLAVVVGAVPLALLTRGQAGGQLHWLGRPSVWNWTLIVLVLLAMLVLRPAARPELARERTDGFRFALLSFALPPLLLLALSETVTRVYVDRYIVYAYEGFALVLGAAAARFVDRWRARPSVAVVSVIALAAVLVPWSIRTREPASRKDDVYAVAAAVAQLSRPGDGILFLPARRREWLLASPQVLDGLDDVGLRTDPAASDTLEGVEWSPAVVRSRLLTMQRVIVLEDPAGAPDTDDPGGPQKRAVLRADFHRVTTLTVLGARVELYRHD